MKVDIGQVRSGNQGKKAGEKAKGKGQKGKSSRAMYIQNTSVYLMDVMYVCGSIPARR